MRPLICLQVTSKSRIALLGRNGCGKSTLIKLIVGKLRPVGGEVLIDGGARIEYLAQHQLEQLDAMGTRLLDPLALVLSRGRAGC
jgi:ATPase subunit of ABC transporter with duplicated ATPase domains